MIHRLVLIVWLISAVSATKYNISIAPLVEAIEKADALYRDWREILDDLQSHSLFPALKMKDRQDAIERAVVAMWKDREPCREIAVEMDPHMKKSLLDDTIARFKDSRPDLVLRGSTHVRPPDNCPGRAYCANQRRVIVSIARIPNAAPQTNDDLPVGDPYVLGDFTDEEMRARWYCRTYVWGSNGEEDECGFTQDAPPLGSFAGAEPPQ